jgi:L-alanine-DL-glutamate epimerase-like enolase superfamily enzyme
MGSKILYPSEFTEGKEPVRINGLIWMGPIDEMQRQIDLKLATGFHCLKLKIGALDFNDEFELLTKLRKRYSADDLEIRLDATVLFNLRKRLKICIAFPILEYTV